MSEGRRPEGGNGADPYGLDQIDYVSERAGPDAVREIFTLVRPYWQGRLWLVPVIATIGLVASVAEVAGVGVIILLLSIIIRGKAEAIETDGGLIDRTINQLLALTEGSLRTVALLAFALLLLRVASVTLHRLIATWVEAGISDLVRRRLFHAFLTMPFDRANRSYGEALTVLNRHSWAVAEATDGFASMMLNGCVASLIGGLLFILSPLIAATAIVGMLALTLILRRVDGPAERAGGAAADAARRVSARSLGVLQAVRTIRIFGQTWAQAATFAGESDRLRSSSIRSDLISGVAEPLSHVAYLGIIALIAVVAVRHALSWEQVLAAVALLYRLQPYASEFESQRLHLATLLAPVRAIDDLVARGAPAEERGAAVTAPVGEIRFADVGFAYPGQRRACLDRAGFTIRAGGWTVIDGESGAGKSTIVNLLLRLYAPHTGTILIDGRDLATLDREAWLGLLSVAGQDVELIDGTIADNILLGRPDAPVAEIDRAIRLSGLDDFLAGLRDGAATWIGERGLNLSGGQRQRLGLARAVLRRPAVLILDEATSALDREAEAAILARLVPEMAGATVILISHRLPPGLPIRDVVRLRREDAAPARAPAPSGPAAGPAQK